MADAWPWLAIAGLGAVHGLNPASGWMLAAARGFGARRAGAALRALAPMAVGHAAAVGAVAGVVAQGLSVDAGLCRRLAGVLLVAAAGRRLLRGADSCSAARATGGDAGIAAWCFLMGAAQGAGMMLVPAFGSMCLAANPARALTASGSLPLALAAVGVHTAAMLAAAGCMAAGLCRGLRGPLAQASGPLLRRCATAALLLAGALVVATP